MFNANLTAEDLIALGEGIVVLRNPASWNPVNYVANRDDFIQRLQIVGFTSTAAASNSLAKFTVRQAGQQILQSDAIALQSIAQTVYSVLRHEAISTTIIATDHMPPDTLLQLETTLGRQLEPHQKALYDDLLACLKAHLARPAIVMAWALGYDIVRWWIFSDPNRMAALATQMNKAIANEHDFFYLNEYRVLEACRNSQHPTLQPAFNDTHLRDLQALLDARNDFAHANFNRASINEANAYVERVVRVVTSPPFK